MWKETAEGEWRGTLQDIATGECHHFSDLKLMFEFLLKDSSEPPEAPPVQSPQSYPLETALKPGDLKEALESEQSTIQLSDRREEEQ